MTIHRGRAGTIALTVFELVRQPRSAWSFEVDVRPFGEDWSPRIRAAHWKSLSLRAM